MIDFNKINRILVIRLGKFGDLIVSTFFFEGLKQQFPHLEIDLLALPRVKGLFEFNKSVNKIFYFRKSFLTFPMIRSINSRDYDILIDLNDNFSNTTKYLFKNIKARIKVAYNYLNYSDIDIPVPVLDKEKSHIIDRINQTLISIGIKIPDSMLKPSMIIPEDIEKQIRSEFCEIKPVKKIIAINLSAGSSNRVWGVGSWIQLIYKITNKYSDYNFILLRDHNEIQDSIYIKNVLNDVFFIEQKYFTFLHFASYIKNSDLLITPDTSAVHIASAFTVPTIGLYPESLWNLSSWRPYQKVYEIIRSDNGNIRTIKSDTVYDKFESIIKKLIN